MSIKSISIKKYLAIVVVVILGYFGGTKYYDNAIIDDVREYHKLYEQYFASIEGKDYPDISWDFYQWGVRCLETTKTYQYPTTQQEYLKDKLQYYEEITFKHKPYIHFLIHFVQKELEETPLDMVTERNEFFEKNRQKYIEILQQYLPFEEQTALFNENKLIRNKTVLVTNAYFKEFKNIVNNAIQTREAYAKTPSMFFLLDGGNGKEVPLDDYETMIFRKLIQESITEKRASQLYQAMIAFQIEEQDFYFDTAQETLKEYVLFLKTTSLDALIELNSLKDLIQSLKRPDSYQDDIQAQEESIKEIDLILTKPM
jgi:hypothetical protein